MTTYQQPDFMDDGLYDVIGHGIVCTVIILLTWRVSTGRGYISASLLLLLFIADRVLQAMQGMPHAGWIIFNLIIAGLFIGGVRGCWLGRRFRSMPAASTFD
jgi:hypothetical protein